MSSDPRFVYRAVLPADLVEADQELARAEAKLRVGAAALAAAMPRLQAFMATPGFRRGPPSFGYVAFPEHGLTSDLPEHGLTSDLGEMLDESVPVDFSLPDSGSMSVADEEWLEPDARSGSETLDGSMPVDFSLPGSGSMPDADEEWLEPDFTLGSEMLDGWMPVDFAVPCSGSVSAADGEWARLEPEVPDIVRTGWHEHLRRVKDVSRFFGEGLLVETWLQDTFLARTSVQLGRSWDTIWRDGSIPDEMNLHVRVVSLALSSGLLQADSLIAVHKGAEGLMPLVAVPGGPALVITAVQRFIRQLSREMEQHDSREMGERGDGWA